jgi:hypothetical protein
MTTLNQSESDSVLVPVNKYSEYTERWSLGLDLGKERDYTALVAMRRLDRSGDNLPPLFQVPAIYRFELGVPYTQIVLKVRDVLSRHPFRGGTLVVDKTGVGSAVADLFEVTGISPIKITITSGDKTTVEGREWHVPKNELVSCLSAALHTETLHIHPNQPLADILKQELLDFQTKHTASGYMQHNAREGKHDDLTLACCIALFHANDRAYRSHSNWIEFMRRQSGVESGHVKSNKPKPRVTLKSPTAITTVYLITGRAVNVSENDTVEVTEDEATPLLQAGWQIAA